MTHTDYLRDLMRSLPPREYSTAEISEALSDYWVSQRVRVNSKGTSTTYKYLMKLVRYGFVEKTRVSDYNGIKMAYWRWVG